MTRHATLREFLLSCLFILAVIVIAFAWAHDAWLRHYA